MNENRYFFEDELTHVEVGKAGQPGHAHRGPPEVILIGWMVETTPINHKFNTLLNTLDMYVLFQEKV